MDTMEGFKPDREKLEQVRAKMANSRLRQMRAMTGHVVSRLSSFGIGTGQAVVLVSVCAMDNAEPAQIADRAFIPRQTMTAILDKLEAQGFVVRAAHPSDRRRKILTLTESGFRKALEIWEGLDAFEESVMSVLSPDERAQLESISAKVAKRLNEIDASPLPLT